MSELSCYVDNVKYKTIKEKCQNGCNSCCADDDYSLCRELLKISHQCNGIIWIKAETEQTAHSKKTEMIREQQKENKQNQPKPKHVHAGLMLEYAKEAMRSDTPWDAFEYLLGDRWVQCSDDVSWEKEIKYRKKPKTVNINGYEVPEPLRVQPADGTVCYYPDTLYVAVEKTTYRNADGSFHTPVLKAGLLHLSSEAAKLHLEALLSFTKT